MTLHNDVRVEYRLQRYDALIIGHHLPWMIHYLWIITESLAFM